MIRLGWAPALCLLAGCSGYYNGAYNAERLATSARRAERAGRTFDATTLWGQVAVRAESSLVRHPHSGWSDRVRLLQGTALVKINDCPRALPPLEHVMVAARQSELVEQAALLVGTCRIATGDPMGASSAYARLTASHDSARRNFALWAHGRALRLGGSPAEALAELSGSTDARARGERAAALALLGRLTEATAVADSLLRETDSLAPWDSLYVAFAAHDPAAASALADRLSAAPAFPVAIRVRVLLQDARRLLEADPVAGGRRLTEAERLASAGPLRAEVLLHASMARIAAADSPVQLQAEVDSLGDLSEGAGPSAARMLRLVLLTKRVLLAADSTTPGTPEADLRLFLAAEMARDSIGASRFAAGLFHRVVTEWPDSPFAPKALLALIDLQSPSGDSLRAVARAQYPDSPYILFAEGEEAPAYQALEDSLHQFALNFRPESRRPTARPRRPANPAGQPKPTTRTPDDLP